MKIRRFEKEDMAAIMAIQGKFPSTPRWSASDYANLAGESNSMLLVAELETTDPPKILGFAALRRVIDEAELLNLAVDPSHQTQGVGKALLRDACGRMLEACTRRLFLEVRVSNKPALGLYSSLGFSLHSLRKGYYRDPQEDAYVMCLELGPPSDQAV